MLWQAPAQVWRRKSVPGLQRPTGLLPVHAHAAQPQLQQLALPPAAGRAPGRATVTASEVAKCGVRRLTPHLLSTRDDERSAQEELARRPKPAKVAVVPASAAVVHENNEWGEPLGTDRGDSRGWARGKARHLLARLTLPPTGIIVESTDTPSAPSAAGAASSSSDDGHLPAGLAYAFEAAPASDVVRTIT